MRAQRRKWLAACWEAGGVLWEVVSLSESRLVLDQRRQRAFHVKMPPNICKHMACLTTVSRTCRTECSPSTVSPHMLRHWVPCVFPTTGSPSPAADGSSNWFCNTVVIAMLRGKRHSEKNPRFLRYLFKSTLSVHLSLRSIDDSGPAGGCEGTDKWSQVTHLRQWS